MDNGAKQAVTVVTTLFNTSSVLHFKTLLILVWFWALKKKNVMSVRYRLLSDLVGFGQNYCVKSSSLTQVVSSSLFVHCLFACQLGA